MGADGGVGGDWERRTRWDIRTKLAWYTARGRSKKVGLLDKYRVTRRNDPSGKHKDCRYFVLDPRHDPLAFDTLRCYSDLALRAGYKPLADDLDRWLSALAADLNLPTSRPCPSCHGSGLVIGRHLDNGPDPCQCRRFGEENEVPC